MRKVFFFCLAGALLVAVSAMAQNKVVVIPLNSTKINKQQTLSYDPYSLQPFGTGAIGTTNGCTCNYVDTFATRVPLTLPVGAKIVSVSAAIYDGLGSTGYSLSLVRDVASIGSSILTSEFISTATGGAQTIEIVEANVTPALQETVDAGESFNLNFSAGAPFANGFCGAQVTIELP